MESSTGTRIAHISDELYNHSHAADREGFAGCPFTGVSASAIRSGWVLDTRPAILPRQY
jgi:hypothetical protein